MILLQYLLKELVEKGLWTSDVRNQIIADHGSVANVASIPQEIKNLYKTVWEIKQKVIIDQAADRGAFICQSQSLNIHIAEPTNARLTSMHFYAWKQGLKTGMYYLRTRPKAHAIQFTVDQIALSKTKKASTENDVENENTSDNVRKGLVMKSTPGLDYAAEQVCESCSA
jgi:ribonucleoside-diphosphate reductase alpha chain/ribonucleoside-diphosphate reductase subunit M1